MNPIYLALTYLPTYLLTAWSRVFLEKLTGVQLVKKFPICYGTRRFFTTFTSARHLSLSWSSLIQSISPTSHFMKIHFIIILPSTPWVFQVVSFPLTSPPKPHTCLYHTCYMHRQPHSSWFDHPNNIGWGVQIIKLHICSFLHSPVTSSLLGPNTLLNTLFSKTLSPRSSFNVSDQVSYPYKTTGKIIFLYILSFKSLNFWIAFYLVLWFKIY